ncbi:MAG: SMI1/KNR4 family protein [Polyangiaceae bacterium]|nr:SMI1/KNR4 family protein [Polyangiaceae bacterium]
MHIKVKNPYGPTTREEIQRFEARWKVKLPDDYKLFLLESNGGAPTPRTFHVPRWEHEGSALDFFYGIHDRENSSLDEACEAYTDRIPADLIPIAADAFGNNVCIGWKGKRRGKIYFWDHEDELDENGLCRQDYRNVFLVANRLQEFLDKLEELEDE